MGFFHREGLDKVLDEKEVLKKKEIIKFHMISVHKELKNVAELGGKLKEYEQLLNKLAEPGKPQEDHQQIGQIYLLIREMQNLIREINSEHKLLK
tara:strand:+ start:166 stop:450 length:285 start_codon:yes stop_codon:yes gene_type:complete